MWVVGGIFCHSDIDTKDPYHDLTNIPMVTSCSLQTTKSVQMYYILCKTY